MSETDEPADRDTAPRKMVAKCPFCGSRLLMVAGVARYVREVELDEQGGIHAVVYSDLQQVPYHRTTWIECDENCSESNEWPMEHALFGEEEEKQLAR